MKQILRILIWSVLTLASTPLARAYELEWGALIYDVSVSGEVATVVGINSNANPTYYGIDIPRTIRNGSTLVTKIKYLSFSGREKRIEKITIPSSIQDINTGVFNSMTWLEKINVDSKNTYYTSVDGVLFSKDMSSILRLPIAQSYQITYQIPSQVKLLGYCAFWGCKFSKMHIPDSVTTIGSSAFKNCSALKEIIIPNQVTEILSNAFEN